MGLSIDPKVRSVRIEDRDGVEQALSVLLIEADRKNDFELLRDLCKMFYSIVFLHRLRKLIIFVLALLAEILTFKQLWKKDHLSSFRCCLTYQSLCFFYVFCYISAAAHLNCGTSYVSHLLFLLLSFDLTFLFMFDPLFFQHSKDSHHFYIS